MNFKPDLAAKVMSGEKTATRRLVSENPRSPWWREECGYKVGQNVAICPGRGKCQIGKARVRSVKRMRLGFLDSPGATAEGFNSPAKFEAAWREINGAYDPDAIVWRIGLEAVQP